MAKQNQANPEDLRYNYLGFEYAPGKLDKFWDSEEEKKKFVDKIKERLKISHAIERDFSVINAKQLNKADRIIISAASVLMILSLILPYYHFEAFGNSVIGSPISFFVHIGYISNFVAWGNFMMKIIFVMSIVMILFSPIVGVINLIALNTGLTKPDYFARLKSIGKLNLLAILLYVVFFILIATAQINPFGSLGIPALGEHLSLATLIGMSSFSIWLNIGAHFLGSIPAMEL